MAQLFLRLSFLHLLNNLIVAGSLFAFVEASKAIAQSPSSVAGRTLELTVAGGTFPFASSGAYRFLPSATDSAYAIVPIMGDVDPSIGTYSYNKTGPNTATLSFVDAGVGGLTASVTFSTANSGTYVLTSTSFPGGSQHGTFALYAGSAPVSLAASRLTATITSGESPFASYGAFEFIAAPAGNTYEVLALYGNVTDSSGTYSYTRNSEYTGLLSFEDSAVGSGFSFQLSFDSADTGTFFLRKSGSLGYQTGVFEITATAMPPSITSPPISARVALGGAASFQVVAGGTEPLSYQWLRNGLEVPGANSASLSLLNVQQAQAGSYTVRISNSAGSIISEPAQLEVVVPPAILEGPTGQDLFAGASVTFTVQVQGTPPFQYQWKKDGSDISEAVLSTYTIQNVQVSDAGSYAVRVVNDAGAVTSAEGVLTITKIAGSPPQFSVPQWESALGFSAQIHAEEGATYTVQWSSNCIDWYDLRSFVASKDLLIQPLAPGTQSEDTLRQQRIPRVSVSLLDSEARNSPRRFYRVVSP